MFTLKLLTILVLPTSLFFICILLFKILKDFFKKSFLIDSPTQRSNHDIPTPKGAGLIVIPLVIFSTVSIFFFTEQLNKEWIIFFISVAILTCISLLDDIYNLSFFSRLSIQFVCVLISTFAIIDQQDFYQMIMGISKNYSINFNMIYHSVIILLVLFWVWIINLYNFMDGMDGITATQVCSFALGVNLLTILGYLGLDFQLLSIIIFSVFLGFYKLNKPPAKIFLGDTGSVPIGYIIGLILIKSFIFYNILIPLIILTMYHLLDATITIFIRLSRGENIFQAHSSHFYQKPLKSGFSHSYVLKWIQILNLFLLIISLFATSYPITCLLIALISCISLLKFFSLKGAYNE